MIEIRIGESKYQMGDWMIELFKQLGGFTILAQTLVHMSASKKFEPYIRLLVAVITIVILMTPILDFVLHMKEGEVYSFEAQIERSMQQYLDTQATEGYIGYEGSLEYEQLVEELLLEEVTLEEVTSEEIETKDRSTRIEIGAIEIDVKVE